MIIYRSFARLVVRSFVCSFSITERFRSFVLPWFYDLFPGAFANLLTISTVTLSILLTNSEIKHSYFILFSPHLANTRHCLDGVLTVWQYRPSIDPTHCSLGSIFSLCS